MVHVIVLGTAAGGGVPQWNCGCATCSKARSTHPDLRRTQASIAVSADGAHWFLVNASPDLRQQLMDTPRLDRFSGRLRHSPICGVILTNGEIDAIVGLLSLREGSPFSIHAHPRVLETLATNSIFNVLDPVRVPRLAIETDTPFEPGLGDGAPSGLRITAFAVPGKPAWYREGMGAEDPGDTIGLEISDTTGAGRVLFIPACAEMTDQLRDRLEGAPLVFFDGTLWDDDELIRLGLASKTGQRMGHMSMAGEAGSLAALADLGIGQKIFLHINNSNPVLLPDSPERLAAEEAGWLIPHDGMEVVS